MRAFRFGATFTGPTSRERWIERARRAEALGYDIFVMPDHLGKQFAPVPALMAVADATSRLRIGSFVFANDYRHPLMLAKEVATLDVLSGGRLELGIGAGWSRRDYERLGAPYDPPPVRVSRLEESVRLLKRLFAGETVDHSGTYYRARHARLEPRPLQRPRPPLMIAGGGRRMLAIAAREADIVALLPRVDARGRPRVLEVRGQATATKVERVRQAAGDRFAALELNVIVADADVGGPLAQLKRLAMRPLRSPHFLYGSVRQLQDDLLGWRERLGITYFTIPGGLLERFAPVVAALAGR